MLIGVCVGISTAIVPAYIKGITPKQIQGIMGTFNQLLQTMGVLWCYIGGFWLLDLTTSDRIVWRIFLGAPILILSIRIISLVYVFPYDSPVYQYSINRQALE